VYSPKGNKGPLHKKGGLNSRKNKFGGPKGVIFDLNVIILKEVLNTQLRGGEKEKIKER